jgi:hypothetical protein
VSENPAKEAFNDLLTYIEQLETQTGAILEFLRDRGIVTDEKLAPYLEQASKASDVRLRAARARMEHLFTADEKAKPATEGVPQPGQNQQTQTLPESDSRAEVKKSAGEKPRPSPEEAREPSEILSSKMETETESQGDRSEESGQRSKSDEAA